MLTSFSRASFSLGGSPLTCRASTRISFTAMIRPVAWSRPLKTRPREPCPITSPLTHEKALPWIAQGASFCTGPVLTKESASSTDAAKEMPVTVPSNPRLHCKAARLLAPAPVPVLGDVSGENGSGPSAMRSQLLSIRIRSPLPTSKLVQLLLATLIPRKGPRPSGGGGGAVHVSSLSMPSACNIAAILLSWRKLVFYRAYSRNSALQSTCCY
mmetsp:Transcript_13506/g.31781  ORF Transcript_13506/g.31781 Transcript_13506/m.31781 type:complete len:213 (-) Transcript_13506:15-653(-)